MSTSSAKLQTNSSTSWTDLRDERGRLYGRVDSSRFLLEIRRNQKTATFDLRDYLKRVDPREGKGDDAS